MAPIFYRDGAAVLEEQILGEGAMPGVPLEAADALFAGAHAGDAGYCALLEELILGLECVTGAGFGVRDPDLGPERRRRRSFGRRRPAPCPGR
jgi:hypothetical protein